MRILVFLMLALIAAPAYSQITIGRYRVNGTIEFNADLQIEEVVPMTTIPDPAYGWNLDDNTAAYGGVDLTAVNSPTFDTGKLGNAAYLSGALSYPHFKILNADAGALVDDNITGSLKDGFTISVWVYPTDTPPLFAARCYAACTTRTGSNGWVFGNGVSGLGGGLLPAFKYGSNTTTSTTALTLNAWNFVCYKYEPGQNQRIFVNSATNTGIGSSTLTMGDSPNDFYIGTDANASSASMVGRLDAFYFWTEPLSDAQIAALYNDGDGVELAPAPAFSGPLRVKSSAVYQNGAKNSATYQNGSIAGATNCDH